MNKTKENYVKPAIEVLHIEPLSVCAGTATGPGTNIPIGGRDDGGDGPV